MTVTALPRFGLTDWTAGGDPFTRTQRRADNGALDQFAARAEQGPQSHVPTPTAPTLTTATTGGTLAPSTYGYRITALSAASGSFSAGETRASPETTIVVPAGTNTNVVNLTWAAVPGSNGYRVYGRTPSGEQLLATVAAGVTVWQDTGANPPGAALPTYDTTPGMPTAGIHGRFYWSTDDRGGRLWYDTGAAMVDVGPGPVSGPQSGSTALIVGVGGTFDDVLVVRGKLGQTGDLFHITDPSGSADRFRVTAGGEADVYGGLVVRPAFVDTVPVVVNGLTSQTADLQQWQVNGASKASVTAGGRLVVTGGADVAGSPSGYTDELRFTSAGSGALAGLSTLGTGTPHLSFDHRAAGNAGDWLWRNGTGGGTIRMGLDGAGTLTLNTGDLILSAGAVRLNSTVSGRVLYQDGTAVYVGAVDAARPVTFRSQGVDSLTLNNVTGQTFASWSAASGVAALVNGTVGGVQKFYVGADGSVQAAADVHYLGRAALGATGVRLKLQGTGAAIIRAENQAASDVPLTLQGSNIQFQDGSSVTLAGLNVPSSGNTALFLRVNSPTTGVTNSAQVALGAVDSGGTGFRVLCVGN